MVYKMNHFLIFGYLWKESLLLSSKEFQIFRQSSFFSGKNNKVSDPLRTFSVSGQLLINSDF